MSTPNIQTMPSRMFNHAASQAKRFANTAPVFITERGKPSHVLMSIGLYQRLTCNTQKIADLLAMPAIENDVLDAYLEMSISRDVAQAADFS